MIYSNEWAKLIHNQTCDTKLRTYSKFKNNFEIEGYIISLSLAKRRMFTWLRISAHHLAIEKGRYMQIPKDNNIACDFCKNLKTNCICNRFKYNRLCKHCNVVEDEMHFLLKCSMYDSCRSDFLKDFESTVSCNPSSDPFECFSHIMSYRNGSESLVCEYVNTCFDIRTQYYDSIKSDGNSSSEIVYTRSGRPSKAPNRLNL